MAAVWPGGAPRAGRMCLSKHPYKPRPAATLKAATNDLVTAVGGQAAAADELGQTKGTVFRWTDDSEDNAHRSIPAQAIRTLERVAVADGAAPIVTQFLAAEAGFALVRLSPATLASDWNAELARLASEASDVIGGVAKALSNPPVGRVLPAEAGALVVEIDQACAVFAALRQRVTALRDGRETPGHQVAVG